MTEGGVGDRVAKLVEHGRSQLRDFVRPDHVVVASVPVVIAARHTILRRGDDEGHGPVGWLNNRGACDGDEAVSNRSLGHGVGRAGLLSDHRRKP